MPPPLLIGLPNNDDEGVVLLKGKVVQFIYSFHVIDLNPPCMNGKNDFFNLSLSDLQRVFEVFCLTHCASSVPDKQITAGYGCGNVSGPNDRYQRSK